MKDRRVFLSLICLTALLLAGCGPALIGGAPTRVPMAQVPTPQARAVLTAEPVEPVNPAEPVDAADPAAPVEVELGDPTPTSPAPPPVTEVPSAQVYATPEAPGMRAGDAVLMLSAPIPAAADIMEWRPPAVPVPHALHPNDHYWLRRPLPSGHVDWGLDWYPYGGNGWGTWRVHHGMDFPNDPGTPVLAAGDGVVVWVKEDWAPIYVEIIPTKEEDGTPAEEGGDQEESDQAQESAEYGDQEEQDETGEEEASQPTKRVLGPYGNYVIIRHDWGWGGQPVYTVYAHLLEVFVQVGDQVRAGELIAGVGNTGGSSGPHLHFEVRIGDNDYNHTYNPGLWMAPYEGWGTLAGRVTTAGGTFLYNAVLTITPVDEPAWLDADLSERRTSSTYANDTVNPDPMWGENFVIPDLPAGEYRLEVRAGGETLETTVSIRPGITTFVKLHTRPASG